MVTGIVNSNIVELCKYLLEYDSKKSMVNSYEELIKFCKWETTDFISKKVNVEKELVMKTLKFIEEERGFVLVPKNDGLPCFKVDREKCNILIVEFSKIRIP